MASHKLFWSKQINNSPEKESGDRHFFLAIFCSVCLITGCSQSRLNQCEQIFQIVREVNSKGSSINNTNESESVQIKSWLKAASLMNRAADKIEALHINSGELIQYQNQLATVYRIYSQATYDAVAARENKNLSGLESARERAFRASEIQDESIEKLNQYCSSR
ncbi:MAG: hypothetical protein AAGE96_02415 [Cyanobacteria bacterium P01_G01_bin.19]